MYKNIVHSEQLEKLIRKKASKFTFSIEARRRAYYDKLHRCTDMSSTAGYDNDGCIGPELLDNGVTLAFECRNYDPQAKIFFATDEGDETAFYQYGKDEQDALQRLMNALASD